MAALKKNNHQKMKMGHSTKKNLHYLSIDDFFKAQKNQDLLRLITCGSVDDGKSTLLGRLLWESKQLFDDQLLRLVSDSKKYGTQGENIDFALLVDGLSAEREQGITIDVAYRFFATAKRKFIVADTPGHEQYTRNMITGASTADAAILLVDARAGLMTQTKRHAYLAALMGIRHIILAINKMDLVNFDPAVYENIKISFEEFSNSFDFQTISTIPVSALHGDNIVKKSINTSWYHGSTLISTLDGIKIDQPSNNQVVFSVQHVNRPNSEFRGFSGTVMQGKISIGDEIQVTASGQTAVIADILMMDRSLNTGHPNDAVTLRLDREVDISRGDVISFANTPLEMSDQFQATIVWLNHENGFTGRSYDLKLANQWTVASITDIKYRININTLGHEASKELHANDISICNIATNKLIVFDSFKKSKFLGSFILVDRFTNATVAAGLIKHSLRRAKNIHKQALSITRLDREQLNGHKGKVVWFTGLSGSGKTTFANALELELHGQGLRTYILDGDNIRYGLNHDLGFTDFDRVENIRRISEVAKLMMDAGLIVITAFISPFKQEREMAKELIGRENFIEVYVNTPLEVCESRDVKGLYKLARAGKIPNMTGINSPYEPPDNPSYVACDLNIHLKDLVKFITSQIH